jgi:hypothetical protein
MLTSLLKTLAPYAIELVSLGARQLVKIVRREVEPDEPSHPLSHRDVQHQQDQIRRATTTKPKP